MKELVLEARKRTGNGTSAAKQTRNEGFVPAVIYGKDFETRNIEIPLKEFTSGIASRGANALFGLKIDGESYPAMALEIQREPLSKRIFHVDFHKVSLDKPVETSVPVKLEGESKGVKMGGVLEQVMWDIEVQALPLNIPEFISVDMTGVELGGEIRVKDIEVSSDVKIVSDPEDVIALVAAKREETEETDLFGDASAEPEVIKKGKEEE